MECLSDEGAKDGWPRACFADSRGSILLLTVLLLSLLSVLFLFVTNSVLLGTRARESLRSAVEMFYLAEAGLSHGRAFCVAYGEGSALREGGADDKGEVGGLEADAPFGVWLPFGRGDYRIEAFRLSEDPQALVERDSGILLVATAQLDGEGRKRICLLLDEPPSCGILAWWEPD